MSAGGRRLAVVILWLFATAVAPAAKITSDDRVTFNRDVAPILFAHCVECHRPQGAAPFSLLTFEDVKKRSKLVAHVVEKRLMPPWLPEPGPKFHGEQRLSDAEISTIRGWVNSKRLQGDRRDLPPVPSFASDWQLGPPDLVVELPEAFTLAPSGPDLYRNFVIPHVIDANRYVRAVEFQPGGTKAVHHAFILTDTTGDALRLDRQEAEPGFPGMAAGRGARVPGGFMSWQPGRKPIESPEGMTWQLAKGSDLVLQLHLRPTGKSEVIRPKVALYFTEKAPTRPYMVMLLRSTTIDIAAGESNYAVESSYQLPVDTHLIGLLPHMHYLGRKVNAWAELPDGTRQDLLTINRWDFAWQSDYRYVEPIALPKGTVVRMRYLYDNSAENPRNPNNPPLEVQYGLESSDEMGELWLWMETKTPGDLATLQRAYLGSYGLEDRLAQNEAMLRKDPKDARSRAELGVTYVAMGRVAEAIKALQQAIVDDPDCQRAYYVLGTVLIREGKFADSEAALTRAVELDPSDSNALTNLGSALLNQRKIAPALTAFQKALQLDPKDSIARQGLEKARSQIQIVPITPR